MRSTVETITPAKAMQWLEQNSHNRPKRKRRVRQYAEIMADGQWRANGDPIRFDRHGRLLDGQHRLEAIVECGKSIEAIIVYDLAPEAFSTIDQGARRTIADHLAVMEIRNHNKLAPALPLIYHFVHGTLEYADTTDRRPTHTTLVKFAQQTEGLQQALDIARMLGLYKLMSDSLSIAVTWILRSLDREKADQFLTLLCADHTLEAKHAQIHHLRDWLLNKKFSPDRVLRMTVAREVFMSWNAWLEGVSIREARKSVNGGFPYPKEG